MARIKPIDLHFSIWGRNWKGTVWANSAAHAKHNFIQDVIAGVDGRQPLRVNITEKGIKQIMFADLRFEPQQPELWPDDEENLYLFAIEALKDQLKVWRV